MATTVLNSTKREAKKADDAVYVFDVQSSKGANIKNVDNDTVALEGNLADYNVKATGAGVLITSKTDKQFKLNITLQKANEKKGIDAGELKLVFADGSLDLTRDGKTIELKDGTELSKKAKALTDLSGKLDSSYDYADVNPPVDPVDPEEPVVGQTFTLTAGLEALAAANKTKADFLEEQELADDAAVADAVDGADTLVASSTYSKVSATGVVTAEGTTIYAVDDSAGVKAAKLADAQAQLNTNLTNLTKLLDDAKAEVAKVTGLNSAISAFNSRVETLESAEKAELEAEAAEAAALASLNTLDPNIVDATIDEGGVVTGFIVVGSDDKLKLADNVSDALKPAATTLLNAVNARIAAEATTAAAELAVENALLTVGYLDFAATAKDAIGAEFRAVLTQAQIDALTRTQVQNELNAQKAIAQAQADEAESGFEFDGETGLFVAVGEGALSAEAQQYNTLKNAADAFHLEILASADGEFTLAATPLLAAQIDAQDKVDDAVQTIATLTELLTDLADAKAVAAELADLNAAIAAAEKAFGDEGFEVPVTVDSLAIASAESDIYLVGTNDAEIVNFGAEGNDLLFVGTSFSFVVLGAAETIEQRVGDAAVSEVFAKQVGANVELFVEQQTFAGNALNSTDDIVQIVLTGVNVADLAFVDGAITLA